MTYACLLAILIGQDSSERGCWLIKIDLLVNKFYGQATKGMR